MEVQAHGNYFEDIKTREITGMSKDEYDNLKDNGYTSSMDIVKGSIISFARYSGVITISFSGSFFGGQNALIY